MSASLLACVLHVNHARLSVRTDEGPRVFLTEATADLSIAVDGVDADVQAPLELHGELQYETFSNTRLLGGEHELYRIDPGTSFHLLVSEDGIADVSFGDQAYTTIKGLPIACEDLRLGGGAAPVPMAQGGRWMPAENDLALAPSPGAARFTLFLGFAEPQAALFTEIASSGDWVEVTRTIVPGVTVTGWTKREELVAPPPPPPPAPDRGGAAGMVGIGGARESEPVKATRDLPAGATIYSRDGKAWAKLSAAGTYTVRRHADGRAELVLPGVTGELWLDPPISPPKPPG